MKKKPSRGQTSTSGPPSQNGPQKLGRYLSGLTLLLFIIAGLFPGWGLWGPGALAYLPPYFSLALILLAASVVAWEYRWNYDAVTESKANPAVPFAIWSIAITAGFGAAFYFLRGETHFLGDGYSLIHELARSRPLLKPRELGEAYIHLWVRDLLGGANLDAAGHSYQVVSIAAGVLFAAVASIGSTLLFAGWRERLVFTLGLLSGGYSLMFFGYAENYSFFCLSILIFTLTGLLITAKRINRWVILIPFAMSVILHVLGAVFLPAALYLLFKDSPVESWLGNRHKSTRYVLLISILIAGIVGFGYIYAHDVYFRFAFVSLTSNRFSVPGYTLFSMHHIADIINLVLLLIPGALLIIPLLRLQPNRVFFKSESSRFLLIASLPALLAAGALDPKLGMARDWDLFSFPGIPLMVLTLWLALFRSSPRRTHLGFAVLITAFGFTSLLSRVLVQARPGSGVAMFRQQLANDHVRGRTGMFTLGEYYREQGDTAAAEALTRTRLQEYPCEVLVRQATAATEMGRWQEAEALTWQARQIDPGYSEVWVLLSRCFLRNGQNDSALIAAQIADGLNPYNWVVQNQLALANFNLGNKSKAMQVWRDLVDLDTTQYAAAFNLARLYQRDANWAEYQHYLTIAANRADTPPAVLLEFATVAVKAGDLSAAAKACRRALGMGIDSAKVKELTGKNPELARALGM